MKAIRLIKAEKPDKGEAFTVAKTKTSLVLRNAADELVTKVPHADCGQRVLFPNFWTSVAYICILDEKGKPLCFENKPATVAKLRTLVDDCLGQNPTETAAAFKKKGIRDLAIGGGSFVLGVVITVASLATTEPGNSFVMMTGLIGVGLIEIIRGIYYFTKASQFASRADAGEIEAVET